MVAGGGQGVAIADAPVDPLGVDGATVGVGVGGPAVGVGVGGPAVGVGVGGPTVGVGVGVGVGAVVVVVGVVDAGVVVSGTFVSPSVLPHLQEAAHPSLIGLVVQAPGVVTRSAQLLYVLK